MPRQPELFPRAAPATAASARAPLAERMRPRTVDEFVGQRHLLGPGRVLRDLLAGGQLESLILWGPPGTGKTTLARLLADASGVRSVAFSAVLHGVKELRQVVADAEDELRRTGKPILLFVDEIHRLNKAQ
ncbi:MAG TPA: AAA family ATPase, partial [Candidatus Binatia bacterium]|nr:AAA family ATPase [Candidatus Binatia bacterium]